MQSYLTTPPASPREYDQDHSYVEPSRTHMEQEGCIVNGWLELVSKLGAGAYGTVYSARNIFNGQQLAVKVLNKIGLDRKQQRFLKREVQLHCAASNHPNVVPVYKIMDSPDCIYVVMEYCSEGDLFTSITEAGFYAGQDTLIKDAFLQILDAVESLHDRGIYHRDLKPENVLISNGGHTLKLADFGLATTDRCSTDFGCGSTFYMSPECQATTFFQGWYDAAANDVWSLGVILVNLACGRNPWKKANHEDQTYMEFLKDPNFLSTILPVSGELLAILKRIFEVDPERRVTLAELKTLVLACDSFTRKPDNYMGTKQIYGQITPDHGSPFGSRSPSPFSELEDTYYQTPGLDASMHIQGSAGSVSSGWSSGSDSLTPSTPIHDMFASVFQPDSGYKSCAPPVAVVDFHASGYPSHGWTDHNNTNYYIPQYAH